MKRDTKSKKNAQEKVSSYIEGLFAFIDNSPTCFQAVENINRELEQAGYQRLLERCPWEIVKGGKYYVNRNDSAVIAFSIPEKEQKGFHIVAAHSDSPCFKLKELPELTGEEHYRKWNVEKYGGMILSTWLDRPLSIAGRVVVKKADGLTTKLVNVDQNAAIIPNVAIHMNRDMNKGIEYNPQTDMLPLAGSVNGKGGRDNQGGYLSLVAKKAGVMPEEILGQDIFLYNRDKCSRLGLDEEYICGPRLDDLECAYAGMKAFVKAESESYITMLAVFDNEEVGSGTKQGADSSFLRDVLSRIRSGLQLTEEEYQCMLAESFLISADNAHAVHPNHPEKTDAVNKSYLNEGIVIKYHGSQRYATDAYSAAVMKDICREAEVPYQTYANRSDIVGGSTLGNILMAQVSMNTVDIGLPQLAMHSALETAGAKDLDYLIRALFAFYSR